MEAPDKIYIQPNAHDRWFEGNIPNDNFVEYIRKDAIIEWTNKMLQDTADRLDFHGNQAFMELYSKLNSM